MCPLRGSSGARCGNWASAITCCAYKFTQHACSSILSGLFYNPADVEFHIEDWVGYDLVRLPETSAVSCGWNYGARCDFCNQMRSATRLPSESPPPQTWEDALDPWGPPCCRMRYHHVFNNPIAGTRIPLDLHVCEACMEDYVRLQVNGNYEP